MIPPRSVNRGKSVTIKNNVAAKAMMEAIKLKVLIILRLIIFTKYSNEEGI